MRAIDADELWKNLARLPGGYVASFAGQACLAQIEDAPTLDCEPVRHGSWIRQDDTYTRFMCSVCKLKNYPIKYSYCPNCGAKMDGGKDNAKVD